MKPLKVGLTGGMASGKSFVGRALAELGAHLIHADDLGHLALEPSGEAYQPAIDAFGRDILDADGRIDRRRLAAQVFGDPDRLARLNAIVHPAVNHLYQSMERDIRAADPDALIVYEAAILIETGLYRNYDRLILVVCTMEQQIERAMSRGLTREEAQARLSSQLPLEEKRKFADYVIDTSGTKEDTIRQARVVYQALRR
ncbi:MAG TPA: dephospho-CoA kinase [Bryobacteraceae bacterium]|jgi:dephospho-CoA kinase